jgi:hypothetical protein
VSAMRKLACAIAPLLGEGWACAGPNHESPADTARIIGPNDQVIQLAVPLYENRVHISGALPPGWHTHAPSSYHSDVEYLEATRKRKGASDHTDARITAQGDAIIAAGAGAGSWSPIHAPHHDITTTVEIGRYGDRVRGTARIMSDAVEFESLRMSHENATELMRWVARRLS